LKSKDAVACLVKVSIDTGNLRGALGKFSEYTDDTPLTSVDQKVRVNLNYTGNLKGSRFNAYSLIPHE
jgi:hypothetical protein